MLPINLSDLELAPGRAMMQHALNDCLTREIFSGDLKEQVVAFCRTYFRFAN
jgi:hypothetical protein